VYRKAKFISYPVTLLKLFMVSRSLLVEFSGSFRYKIMSSVNRDSLTSLSVCIPFVSSSCLTALARNSKTMLNKSGESRYPCLIPDFKEIVSVFPVKNDVGYRFVI
jgi:hypothetical protein